MFGSLKLKPIKFAENCIRIIYNIVPPLKENLLSTHKNKQIYKFHTNRFLEPLSILKSSKTTKCYIYFNKYFKPITKCLNKILPIEHKITTKRWTQQYEHDDEHPLCGVQYLWAIPINSLNALINSEGILRLSTGASWVRSKKIYRGSAFL